jgi:lipoprotein-anchoring transpeptidase ErfK/SrfK
MRSLFRDASLAIAIIITIQTARAESDDKFWEKQFSRRSPAANTSYVSPAQRPQSPPQARSALVPKTKDPVGNIVLDPVPASVQIPGKVVVIFVNLQQFALYENGTISVHDGKSLIGPVSTGSPGYATPITDPKKGPHSVGLRQVDYKSNTYPEPDGGAPMPYAQFFRDDGIALHAGFVDIRSRAQRLNHGLSHGCVRLIPSQAKILYERNADRSIKVIVVRTVEELKANWEQGYYARLAQQPTPIPPVFQGQMPSVPAAQMPKPQ